jgi:hypothetical protein
VFQDLRFQLELGFHSFYITASSSVLSGFISFYEHGYQRERDERQWAWQSSSYINGWDGGGQDEDTRTEGETKRRKRRRKRR